MGRPPAPRPQLRRDSLGGSDMGWENALFDLLWRIIAAIGLVAGIIILARHARSRGQSVSPHRDIDSPASFGPLLDRMLSSSPGPPNATRTTSAATPSDTVDRILLAYAEGALTTDAAAKELVKQLQGSAVDLQLDMDKDLRAAVARELDTRGLA